MTQEDVIEMADKADAEADKVLNMKGEYHPNWHQVRDEIFAKLVAAREREACAKVCEFGADAMHPTVEGHVMKNFGASTHLTQAIRARGEACEEALKQEQDEPVAWYDDEHQDFSRVQRMGWKPLVFAGTTPPEAQPAKQVQGELCEKAAEATLNRAEEVLDAISVHLDLEETVFECISDYVNAVIEALKKLKFEAQPAKQEQCERNFCERCGKRVFDGIHTCTPPLSKQEQGEPVAVKHMMEWVEYLKRKSDYGQHMQIPSEMSAGVCWELAVELEQFINTTPQQRKPLTDEQIQHLVDTRIGEPNPKYPLDNSDWMHFAKAIEYAHNIKE